MLRLLGLRSHRDDHLCAQQGCAPDLLRVRRCDDSQLRLALCQARPGAREAVLRPDPLSGQAPWAACSSRGTHHPGPRARLEQDPNFHVSGLGHGARDRLYADDEHPRGHPPDAGRLSGVRCQGGAPPKDQGAPRPQEETRRHRRRDSRGGERRRGRFVVVHLLHFRQGLPGAAGQDGSGGARGESSGGASGAGEPTG